MNYFRIIGWAAALLLSGCSVLRVDVRAAEGTAGELELKALKNESPEELKSGYYFSVARNGVTVGSCETSGDSATVMKNLEAGTYELWISGHGLRGEKFEVEVSAGRRTSVSVLHRNVLRRERSEAAAATTGKVVLYTVGAVLYAVVWVIAECVSSDGDSSSACSQCGHDPCVCPPKKEPRKEPAVRNYLKH